MPSWAKLQRLALAIVVIAMICGSAVSASAEENHKKGDSLQISVSENPSTGYGWEIMTTPGLKLMDSKYTPKNPKVKPAVVGAAGTRTFTLKCEKSGNQFVCLFYHRPWMPIGSTGEQQQLKMIAVA